MKHRILFPIVLIFLAFSVAMMLAACSGGSDSAGGDGDNALPDLPQLPPLRAFMGYMWDYHYTRDEMRLAFSPSEEEGTVPVYRLMWPLFDDAHARSIARKFGFEEDPKRTELPDYLVGACPARDGSYDPRCGVYIDYRIESVDAELRIRPDAFIYSLKQDGPDEPFSLSDEEARRIAEEFLTEHDLLTEHLVVVGVSASEGGKDARVEFTDKRLGESQQMSMLPITVRIDSAGNVRGVDWFLPDLAIVGEYPIISEAQAYERIIEGTCSYMKGAGNLIDEADLTFVEFHYELACDGSDTCEGPGYYVPVYRFYNEYGSSLVVPALPNKYIFPEGFEVPPPRPTPRDQEHERSADDSTLAFSLEPHDFHDPLSEDKVTLSFEPSNQSNLAPVYKLVPDLPEVDEAYARSLAAKFGMTGEPVYSPQTGEYSFESPEGRLRVSRSDGIHVGFRSSMLTPGYKPPPVRISDDEARQRATEYLAERGLMPADAGVDTMIWDREDEGRVIFKRSTTPAGVERRSTIVVYIESTGRINRVEWHWARLEPLGGYSIVSEQEAFDRLLRGVWFDSSAPLDQTGAVFASVELVLREEQSYSLNSYLVPCYRFRGTVDLDVPAGVGEYVIP